MKAIVFDAFGGTEVLHEAEIGIPQPGPGQVRVRVRAVGVNPVDGKIRSGAMEAIFPTTLPAVPGGEIAGVVDAVGEDVDQLTVGDEVLGWSDTGSYAQYALAQATVLAPKPVEPGLGERRRPARGERRRRTRTGPARRHRR